MKNKGIKSEEFNVKESKHPNVYLDTLKPLDTYIIKHPSLI